MDLIREGLLKIVHGEWNWRKVRDLGLPVQFYNGKWTFGVLPGEAIKITPKDIAKGLLKVFSSKDAVSEWAAFILAASALVDLSEIEESPYGEKLLSMLWDLSFGGGMSDSNILFLEGLVHEK